MRQWKRDEVAVVVFDLGGVLIEWDPRHLYRKLFPDETAMERFLAEVCNLEWNGKQDAGRPFAEAVEELAARFPDQRPLIAAYHERWAEMLHGEIPGSVAILESLCAAGHEVHALTNWSAETFPIARDRYAFFDRFGAIVVSSEVGVTKPDPRIYRILLDRIGRRPEDCLFVDDALPNVAAAAALGFDAIHFTDAPRLRAALETRGVLTAS